jgi:sec-independent protein translocase protein TatB
MLNLDPAKLLVIAVVAIILLGPDKLPQVARQVGGAWRSFNEFRHRMETEVRNTMPDLPSTTEIARLARSPSALLDHLSNMGPDEGAAAASTEDDDAEAGDGVAAATAAAGDGGPSQNGSGPVAMTNGSVARADSVEPGDVTPAPITPAPEPMPATTASAPVTSPEVTTTPPVPAPNLRSPDVIVPGDPSLN